MLKYFLGMLEKAMNKKNILKLKNSDFTIISSNCLGGVISHKLGLKFMSPTVNLFIEPSSFVKFCKNLTYYFEQPLVEKEWSGDYPIALCNDIEIHGLHYRNFSELKDKWNERTKRVNFDNIFIFMIERDGCTYEDILEFDKLSYKNKVVFVSKEMPEIKSAIHIPKANEIINGKMQVKSLLRYRNILVGKRDIDIFDYIKFFNEGIIQLNRK